MNYVLLLGAGFSRNWGGWLADEVSECLLGYPKVDADIKALLWKHKRTGGFEDALAELQGDYFARRDTQSEQRLRKLQDSISLMFSDMDSAIAGINFEFQNDMEYLVRSFVVRFDAVFTLNQDLLIERHYLNDNVTLCPYRQWGGWQIPGMKPISRVGSTNYITGKWTPDDPSNFVVHSGHQPYFKLHGSSNWTDGSGQQLLVMGGKKTSFIDQYPILKWNHERFKAYLSPPDSRLMVIGYSFGDLHINNAIEQAADRGALRVFIIDPLGVDVLDEHRHATIYTPGPLLTRLGPHLIGTSKRSLREIFGNDRVEHGKVMRFFK